MYNISFATLSALKKEEIIITIVDSLVKGCGLANRY